MLSLVYDEPGTYPVTLEVTDNAGQVASTTYHLVLVPSPLVPKVTWPTGAPPKAVQNRYARCPYRVQLSPGSRGARIKRGKWGKAIMNWDHLDADGKRFSDGRHPKVDVKLRPEFRTAVVIVVTPGTLSYELDADARQSGHWVSPWGLGHQLSAASFGVSICRKR